MRGALFTFWLCVWVGSVLAGVHLCWGRRVACCFFFAIGIFLFRVRSLKWAVDPSFAMVFDYWVAFWAFG